MIRFEEENNCFNYRVVGIAVHQDSVLLHQAEGDSFWAFPGGRGEFGETAEQTLKREMIEELGVEIEIVRLLWVVENFFTYAGKQYHELAFYFLMQLPAECKYLESPGPFRGEEKGVELIFKWFPREPAVLSDLPLLPSFLQTSLQELPESVQHVIQRDA
jgi:ADP-ribose pyrophosphatase YjhB (NUDIX family)